MLIDHQSMKLSIVENTRGTIGKLTTIGWVRGVTRQKLEIRIRYRKPLYTRINEQWGPYLSDSYAYVWRRVYTNVDAPGRTGG